MRKKKNKTLIIINFLIIIISTIICLNRSVFYLSEGNNFMAISSILMIFLPLSIYVLEKIIKKEIGEIVKLVFLLFVLAAGVLGAIGNLYNEITYYDKLVHFISGVLVSLLVILLSKLFYKEEPNKKILFLIIVVLNLAIASLWEIFEFLFDTLFDKNAQKGNTDTMLDMITAFIGGILTFLPCIRSRIYKTN